MLYHKHRDKNTMLKALKEQYNGTFKNIEFSHNEGMSRFYSVHCTHTNESGIVKISVDEYDDLLKTHISHVEYKSNARDQFIKI